MTDSDQKYWEFKETGPQSLEKGGAFQLIDIFLMVQQTEKITQL